MAKKLKVATMHRFAPGLQCLRDAGYDVAEVEPLDKSEEATIAKYKGYNAVVAMTEPFTARVLEALKDDLKIVSRHGIGYDSVDIAAAAKLGICCTNTPGAMSTGVAEQAVAMMLECTRRFYAAHMAMQKGEWNRGDGPTRGFEGKTVGFVGFGNIAQRVAQYISGFNCRILAYDIKYNEDAVKKYGAEKASLDQIAAESDFVSVHVPHLPATDKIINAEFLKKMKPTAFLINTSRGGTVDEKALTEALQNKVIKGAALDVFAVEPTPADNPLRYLDNCFVNPHLATNTVECLIAGFEGVVKCFDEFEEGKVPEYCVNRSYAENAK